MMFSGFPYHLIDLWLKSFTKVRILGPLTTASPEYSRVVEFRREQNLRRAPYLEDEHQLKIERNLDIDERSFHFTVERNGVIMACVRATPLPYELSALAPEFDERSKDFTNYYELGRLCTDDALERRGFYASMLVVKAAQFLFMNQLAEGIVGICKTDRVSYMEKLGLQIDPSVVRVSARAGNYQLIHAPKEHLLQFYFIRLFDFFSRTHLASRKRVEVPHESYTA